MIEQVSQYVSDILSANDEEFAGSNSKHQSDESESIANSTPDSQDLYITGNMPLALPLLLMLSGCTREILTVDLTPDSEGETGLDSNSGLDSGTDPCAPPLNDVDADGSSSLECGGDDCNDIDASVFPDALETCNTIDDNCDGQTDEGLRSERYVDGDGDGYGEGEAIDDVCYDAVGYSDDDGDCNDADPDINPGAEESCNGLDEDCDGIADDGVMVTVYNDLDADGYGDDETGLEVCDPDDGVTMGGDCDDGDAEINPAAAETAYDGIDQDCNGSDWADVDGDGYDAESAGGDDCNDDDASVYPDAAEIIGNGIDDNCNGSIDEISAGCTGSPFSTVQGAVDAASDGDTITVCGSFTEDVVIDDKNLTITGDSSATITAVSGSPVTIYASNVYLRNLSLEGSGAMYAGILFTDRISDSGSYILDIDNCSISNNDGYGVAADINYTTTSVALSISGSTIDSNGNTGVSIVYADELDISNSTITNNGNGVWAMSSFVNVAISNTQIDGNGIPAVLAVSSVGGADLSISGGSISNNSYVYRDYSGDCFDGSALSISGMQGSVSGTDISNNSGSSSGVINMCGDTDGGTDLSLSSTTLDNNTSASGDAIVILDDLQSGDRFSSSSSTSWSGNSPETVSEDGDLYTISDLGSSFDCDNSGCE